jgi:peroxiredoxin
MKKTLMTVLAAGVLAVGLATAGGFGQPATGKDGTKEAAKASGVKVGEDAPLFTLKDTDGKEHSLASLKGKVVVLFWFNADCPFVVKHFKDTKTFNNIAANYKDKNVVVMAINSNAPGTQGSGQKRNADAKKEWSMDYPILLDESGETGKAYGARNTPACYVIGADGKVAYMGAIDDNPGEKVGETNYVTKALDEILAGKKVTTAETKPYGCSVKYKK